MNKTFKWNYGSFLLLITGLVVLIAGIYFKVSDLTSSGVDLNMHGTPNGTATINGDGMIFCGFLFCGIVIVMAYNKPSSYSE